MKHTKKEQLRGKVSKTDIFSHFYELYKRIAVELEAYGRYLPHKDESLDEKHDQQEALLIDIQNDIVAYAVVHRIETQEDADMMASFWKQLITFDDDGCCQDSNRIARNLFSYYQKFTVHETEAKEIDLMPAPA